MNQSLKQTISFSCGAYILVVEWEIDKHKHWLGSVFEYAGCKKGKDRPSGVLEVSGVCVFKNIKRG